MVLASKKDDRLSQPQQFWCGALSSAFSKTLTRPFDVVKVRHQVATPETKHGIVQTFRHINKNEGVRALWKGTSIACARLVPFSVLQVLTFHKLRLALADSTGRLSTTTALVAGATSGLIASVVMYPADVIKTRIIVQQGNSTYPSIFRCAKVMLKSEGLTSFYRGVSTTVIGSVPFATAAFTAYEVLDSLQNYSEPSPFIYFANGCIATALAQLAGFPLETIKKKMQVNGGGASPIKHRSDLQCRGISEYIKKIHQTYGMRGFWRGYSISLLKIVPYTGMTCIIYEIMKRHFLYTNGYTVSRIVEEHHPSIDQSLRPHEIEDYLEEIESYEDIENSSFRP